MNDEILINNEGANAPDEKELLRKRKEEQVERIKKQYDTDKKEKEEAKIRMEQEEELEKELKPFYSARKVCIGICAFMWLFAAFCLLSGSLEMSIFLPMCLFALGALAGVNAPIFYKKDKSLDTIVACACAAICFFVGVVIFVMG